MSTRKKFMSKVREKMERAGVTVQAIADKTGLSPQTVMRARGPNIGTCTLNTLATIATALGVLVRDLFDE